MKLTPKAITLINTPNVRRELSGVLHCTEQTIIRYILANKPNGRLTTLAAILKIKELTGLKDDEILEQ